MLAIIELILEYLPMILEIIENCQDNNESEFGFGSHEELKQVIRNPGPLAVLMLSRALADERGLSRRERFRQRFKLREEIKDVAKNLTDEQVQLICDAHCLKCKDGSCCGGGAV